MKKIKAVSSGPADTADAGRSSYCSAIPMCEIAALFDKQDIGKPISDLYPHLKGFCDLPLIDADDPKRPDDFDVVFFATPDGVGQKEARFWLDKGVKVVDYSGDFRFNDAETYKGYAARIGKAQEHASPDLLPKSVYGLAELHRKEIAKARPGGQSRVFCRELHPGSCPCREIGADRSGFHHLRFKNRGFRSRKKPNPMFHYPARYDAINAYKISGHQHVYEIERELGLVAGKEMRITFTPHVLPLSRGILSTIYGNLKPGLNIQAAIDAYRAFYKGEPLSGSSDRKGCSRAPMCAGAISATSP